MQSYKNSKPFFGDLHSHCEVGYGHGSLEDAFRNARLQLDFVAITVHAHWPEIPVNEPRLKDLADYHQRGFQNASQGWEKLQKTVSENYHPGRFVPFLAFEWHSNQYGDHNIYFNGEKGEIIRANSIEALRNDIKEWQKKGIDAIATKTVSLNLHLSG